MDCLNYSQFTQNYIEIVDEFRYLAGEIQDCQEHGDLVTQETQREFDQLRLQVQNLELVGKEQFQKTSAQMYKDGWAFWFKEDAELREQRYGLGF